MAELLQYLSSGADVATIALAIYCLRIDRRVLILEEWRKSISARLATP